MEIFHLYGTWLLQKTVVWGLVHVHSVEAQGLVLVIHRVEGHQDPVHAVLAVEALAGNRDECHEALLPLFWCVRSYIIYILFWYALF